MMFRKALLLSTSGLLCPLVLFAQNLDWKTASSYTKKPVKADLVFHLTNYTKQATNTTAGQLKFAKNLVKELRQYGLSGLQDKNGLVTVQIPSNVKADVPEVVLIARTDAEAQHVTPQVHDNYKGGEIVLQENPRLVLDTYNSPQLTRAYGHDLFTSSGTSALGASSKAGAAILITVAQFLDAHPAVSHGLITLAFAPNDAALRTLAAQKHKTPFIYVLEGKEKGELADQTFYINRFTISFEGNRNVPLGEAYSSDFADNFLIAADFHSLLPRANRPETTTGTRGFIDVDKIVHTQNKTEISGTVQTFCEDEKTQLTAEVSRAFNTVKAMHNKAKNFSLTWAEEQTNIQTSLPKQSLLAAEQAMRSEEITPKHLADRSPKSSVVLMKEGLAVSTLFTGHYNQNTVREYADVDEMEASFRTVLRLITQQVK